MSQQGSNAEQARQRCNGSMPPVIRRAVAREIVGGLVGRNLVSILLLTFRRRRLLARDMRRGRIDFVPAVWRIRLLGKHRSACQRHYHGKEKRRQMDWLHDCNGVQKSCKPAPLPCAWGSRARGDRSVRCYTELDCYKKSSGHGLCTLAVSPDQEVVRAHKSLLNQDLNKGMKTDIIRDQKRKWIWQQAREFALTGAFENFDKVVQALQLLGLDEGLDPEHVLKSDRSTINKLCARSRRGAGRGAQRDLRHQDQLSPRRHKGHEETR